jgi:hypothetical protein
MVYYLSKIICRNSDKPLKSEILTFRGILKLSADYPVERHAFPQYDMREVLAFHDYLAERNAFQQDSVQKVKTFHGFYHGKACLTQNYSRLHAFPKILPRKDMPFQGIIHGKF